MHRAVRFSGILPSLYCRRFGGEGFWLVYIDFGYVVANNPKNHDRKRGYFSKVLEAIRS